MSLTLDGSASLAQAIQHHRAGELDQAELLYRHILKDDPNQADALHLLGVIAHQRGRHGEAIDFIRRALAARPNEAPFHANLAEAYRARGELNDARRHVETAVRLQPGAAMYHNNLGLVYQGLGLHLDAVDQFNTAIRLRPRFAMAYSNLGLGWRELGRTREALTAFREAVQTDPALPEARNNLGQMLLEENQPEEALRHLQEALRLRPGYPEAVNNLGNVLRDLGRLEEAKACYQQVLGVRPNQAMPFNNLGQVFQEEGRLNDALACYEKALALEPNSARFLCNLASALHEQERDADALVLCRRALGSLQPDYAEGHSLLGTLGEEAGDLNAAVASYREAIRLKPSDANTHVSLGHALAERGEIEQGLECFRAALRHDPRCAGAYASLATTLGGKLPEADLEAALRLLNDPMSQRRRAALCYGVAHVLDARGQQAEAGQRLRQANADQLQLLIRQGKGYDPDAHDRFTSQLIANFSPDYFARVRSWGLDTDLPVFIVGLPRSGTTLTEQILASHPAMHGAGELRFARESFEALPALVGVKSQPMDCVGGYHQEAIATAAHRHLERLQALAPQARRIVDKMPDNYLYLGLLVTLFPRARIIHTRRDVRDTALSCWMTNFKHISWACDLEHIAARVQAYERLLAHWRTVLPVPMLEVDYEETVADLEGVARRLVAWCGLAWDPACLDFHRTQRPIRTASVTQVRQPIYRRSVQRWKHYRADLAPLLNTLACAE